ncbi:unnamed protein product, partial [Rhizoctonia solani]
MFKSRIPVLNPSPTAVPPTLFRSTFVQGIAQTSRFTITSDAWTSKQYNYSVAGAFITFIDTDWNLQELVLDIVDLNADHTGAGVGKKIFKSLDAASAAGGIIASVTDNASNNRTMNAELSRRIQKNYGFSLNVKNMSVTCLCHALHLICGAILCHLKAMDPVDLDEIYASTKTYDDSEVIELTDQNVLEEEERLCDEKQAQSEDEPDDTSSGSQINAREPLNPV